MLFNLGLFQAAITQQLHTCIAATSACASQAEFDFAAEQLLAISQLECLSDDAVQAAAVQIVAVCGYGGFYGDTYTAGQLQALLQHALAGALRELLLCLKTFLKIGRKLPQALVLKQTQPVQEEQMRQAYKRNVP
jgi:hypothetical protein